MRRRQPAAVLSSDDDTDDESCFDIEDEASNPGTDHTDTESETENVVKLDKTDAQWLFPQEDAHPPEYYRQQEEDFDEGEYDIEDYAPNSVLLFDVMKGRWLR
jgi:hypothetical protein